MGQGLVVINRLSKAVGLYNQPACQLVIDNGVPLEDIEVSAEGDMNVRGYFGISDKVNRGYERIRVDMKVKSPADVETLTRLAMYSPVYELVSRSVPVEFNLSKK